MVEATCSSETSVLTRTTQCEHIVFLHSVLQLLVAANVAPSSPILVSLILEAIHSSETSVVQEPYNVTSQKTSKRNKLRGL
jgi:hypothetical protein